MNTDPSLTHDRIRALTAVDVRLFGVTHGIYVPGGAGQLGHIDGITDDDYAGLKAATDELNPLRGDVLAIEPTGFVTAAESPTIENIIPVRLPELPRGLLTAEIKDGLFSLLETGRSQQQINNLAYVAAHALLRGVHVHTAETSMSAWEELSDILADAPADGPAKREAELFYRNGDMLARLGDIAIDMTSDSDQRSADCRPVLLYSTGSDHTPHLQRRLGKSGVTVTTNL